MNRYASITSPGGDDILVKSGTLVDVEVDETPVAVTTSGDFRSARIIADNSTSPAFPEISITGGNNFSESGNRWIPQAEFSPTYDDDGNLTNDGRWIYAWDAMNRLTAMSPTAATLTAGVPNQTLSFAYDHLGRRIAKKVSPLPLGEGQGEGAQHDYRYLYEGWNVVAQFTADTSNAITPDATYLWSLDLSGTFHGAGGVGGLHSVNLFPLPMGEGQGEGAKLCLACYDANGNIIAWTETTGRVLQRQDYDPFGNRVIRERLAITPEQSDRLEYGFSTKPLDAETGFIYYIHRYYGPRHGHWLSRDPMQEAGGLNLYGFVGNGGVGNIDKLGLLAFATMPEKILGKYDQGSEIYFGSNGATETAVEPNFLAQEVYEIHLRIPVQFCFCDENNPTLAKFASTATDQKVAAKAYAERIKRLVESKFTADVKWAYLHKDSNEIRRVGLSVRTTLEFRGEPGEACEPWSLETGNSNSHNTVYVDDDWPDTVYGNTLSRIHLRKVSRSRRNVRIDTVM